MKFLRKILLPFALPAMIIVATIDWLFDNGEPQEGWVSIYKDVLNTYLGN